MRWLERFVSRRDSLYSLPLGPAADIVGEDSKANPRSHCVISAVAATSEPVLPFEPTNGAFTAGPPTLGSAESGLAFLGAAGSRFLTTLGDGHGFNPPALAIPLIGGTVVAPVGGHDGRIAPKLGAMPIQGGTECRSVRWVPGANRVIGHKPIFRFDDLHFVAKLHGMSQFTLLNGPPIGIRYVHQPIGDPVAGGGGPTLADDRVEIVQSLFDLGDSARGGLIQHGNLRLRRVDQPGSS